MSKNQKISMAKDDGTLIRNIFIGVSWDANRYAGEEKIDIDIQGLVTNSDRKIIYPDDIVNYSTYNKDSYPWIEFSGDNQDGEDSKGVSFNGKHYDECFIVHSDKFPANRTDFMICLTIFQAIKKRQTFGMVSNATLDILDYDNPTGTSWHYDLSEDLNFENLNAIEMGRLYRYNGGFRFQAIGSGYIGGAPELFENFGLSIGEEQIQGGGSTR